MDDRLEVLCKEVDYINEDILRLLNQRVLAIKEINSIRDKVGIDYLDSAKEDELLNHIIKSNNGPLPNDVVKEVFQLVFKSSLQYLGLANEKKLLISDDCNKSFLNIYDIFGISPSNPIIIAGPCSIENKQYLEDIGSLLKKHGVRFIRGGAYKPRTSPYEFQGLGKEGLKLLHEVGKKYDLFTVTEIVDPRDVELFIEYADVLQIGARNMQNFELLKEVGKANHPVLLKRGISATIEEWMYAAEYIALQGNRKIILCERGIRTFETKTRNTLDISSIPIIKKETNLPIIVDLSHSLGRKDIISNIAKASMAVGADGIMVEVHPIPELALSDSKQQLNPIEFVDLMNSLA